MSIDPWELLRDAREVAQAVVNDARSIAYAQWSPEQHRAEVVRDRIDAALEQHVQDMKEHRRRFVNEVKDLDRTLAAWKRTT